MLNINRMSSAKSPLSAEARSPASLNPCCPTWSQVDIYKITWPFWSLFWLIGDEFWIEYLTGCHAYCHAAAPCSEYKTSGYLAICAGKLYTTLLIRHHAHAHLNNSLKHMEWVKSLYNARTFDGNYITSCWPSAWRCMDPSCCFLPEQHCNSLLARFR